MKLRLMLMWCVVLILFIAQTAQAQNTTTVTGFIDGSTSFIEFPIQVTASGSTIILDIRPTSGNLDTLLYLVDSNGNIVSENDDRVRGDTSSRIVFPQAEQGNYTAIATRFGVADGTSSGDFELNIEVLAGTETTTTQYRVTPDDLRAVGLADVEVRPQAEWTIIAYYGGDNNLEPGLQFDFDEFELAGGSNQNVRIIMLLDRSPENSDANGNWVGARVYEVGFDISGDHLIIFPPTIDSQPLLDLGDRDTSDGEFYAQYLTWALTHFPARNYAFSIASHGAGWKGVVTDDTSRAQTGVTESIMTLPELQQAFEIAKQTAGVDKFALMINEACSMASIEYFAALAPYFDYSLASPEIVIDPALDMTLFTARLNGEQAAVDMPALGVGLVDKYVTLDMRLAGDADAAYFTHSLFDLSNYQAVVDAVEGFASVVNENPSAYASLLGQARTNTYTYTAFAGSNTKIDMGSLMREVLKLSRDPKLINAANAVLEALDASLIYGNAGENVFNIISYYNIYFPATSSSFQISYFDEAQMPQWGRMLRNFYNAVTPKVWGGTGTVSFHPPIAPRIQITSQYPLPGTPISIFTSATLGFELTGRNVAYVDTTFDRVLPDGTVVRYQTERLLTDTFDEEGNPIRQNVWLSGVDRRAFAWDVALPVVSDGISSLNEYIVETEDVAFMDGVYYDGNSGLPNEVSIIFSKPQGAEPGRVQRVVSRTTGNNALAAISIPAGSRFFATKSVVTGDGRVVQELGNIYVWPDGGLTYTYQPAPTGQYNIGILVTSYGGTTGYTSVTVDVNNDGLNPNLRAGLRTDAGFILTRPSDWGLLSIASDVWIGYYRTSSQDANSNISAYFSLAPEASTDLTSIPREMLTSYYGVTWDEVYTDTTVAGAPAIEFNFSYEDPVGGRGTIDAKAFAVFNPNLGLGMVFTSEVVRGTSGDIQATYDQLKTNLRFFSPAEILDSRQWQDAVSTSQAFAIEGVRYPRRLDWGQGTDGIWTRHAIAADNPETTDIVEADMTAPTFVAFTKIDAPASVDAVLNDLVTQYAIGTGTEFVRVATRTLNTATLSWRAVLYTVNRNGVAVVGRMYVTIPVEGGPAYAAWVETFEGADTGATYSNTLEWIIDGFQVDELGS
ncbi:MAG: clostripain-related cysteine peptidase [bacterium]|nr:clostripain-related cysteine peptidase [bacterium]